MNAVSAVLLADGLLEEYHQVVARLKRAVGAGNTDNTTKMGVLDAHNTGGVDVAGSVLGGGISTTVDVMVETNVDGAASG